MINFIHFLLRGARKNVNEWKKNEHTNKNKESKIKKVCLRTIAVLFKARLIYKEKPK